PAKRKSVSDALLRQSRWPLPKNLSVGSLDLDILEPSRHAPAVKANHSSPAVRMRKLELSASVQEALDLFPANLDDDVVPAVVLNGYRDNFGTASGLDPVWKGLGGFHVGIAVPVQADAPLGYFF